VRDDIRSILTRLRPRDARELDEYGLDLDVAAAAFASPAVLARIFAYDLRPTAIVTFHELTPRALVVSMVATDEWGHVAHAVIRWGVKQARPALLARGYGRAECRTMEGHAEAIRLLERLGFVLECRLPQFGARGTAFLQYTWRLSDHVHLEAAASAATEVR
jgi:hypothetical protein